MKRFLVAHWPLISVIVLVGIVWVGLFRTTIRRNDGNIVYSLDDPYIHMSMARNLAEHGVWGVTRYSFSSSSSSPLWTALLACVYRLFGPNEAVPMVLNLILAVLLLSFGHVLIGRHLNRGLYSFAFLMALSFLYPLVPLIFVGQEHIMHALVTLIFVLLVSRILSSTQESANRPSSAAWGFLILSAILNSVTRYESLFLVAAGCMLFASRKRFLSAFTLAAAGVFLPATYGMISRGHGWFLLPNTLLIKGLMPSLTSVNGIIDAVGFNAVKRACWNPHLLAPILGCLIVIRVQHRKHSHIWTPAVIAAVFFIAGALLHLQMAGIIPMKFMRYEAYLMPLAITAAFLAIPSVGPDGSQSVRTGLLVPGRFATALFILFAVLPLAYKTYTNIRKTPAATSNIYQQQYQMGLFLREHYEGDTIVLNDIGATTFLSDIRIIDICGLADREVAQAIIEGRWNLEALHRLTDTQNARVAVNYASWLESLGGVPAGWQKLGEWGISNNVVCGDEVVSFYAIDTEQQEELIRNLAEFNSRLPQGVISRFFDSLVPSQEETTALFEEYWLEAEGIMTSEPRPSEAKDWKY